MLTLTSKRALGTDGGDHGSPNPHGLISIVKKPDVILNFAKIGQDVAEKHFKN